MRKVTKYFVRFWRPGLLVGEDWENYVGSLDPAEIEWPKDAYAFTLHEREDVVDGDQTFKGTSRQVGPTYYHPDSRVETLEEVKRNPKASRILVQNMECNGWTAIIWSRWDNWPQAFDPEKDLILSARGETT